MGERDDALEEAARMLDGWVEHDESVNDLRTADAIWTAARCIRGLKEKDRREPCYCEGCPETVELWSRSALCRSCANEDCEHGGPTP